MNRTVKSTLILAGMLIAGCVGADAQKYPERRHVRSGNKAYEKQDYTAGEEDYRQGLEKTPGSFEAAFNLGDALYKQGRYSEAGEVFGKLAERKELTGDQLSRVHYNIGNSQFAEKKLQEALESYKMSLRFNPGDLQAKYNLAYVQKLLEQEDQNQQNDQNQDRNQNDQNNDSDQDQNQNDRQNDDGQDENEQDNRDDQNDRDENQDQNQQPEKPQGESPPRKSEMTREDAEQMLNAIQQQEDKTRDKVNEQQETVVGRSGKNW